MINKINKITLINILSSVLLQGIAFFTTPIFTNVLGPFQYGIYSVFNAWLGVFSCIMGLGVTYSLGIGMYTFKESYYEFRSSILVLDTMISVGIIGLCLLLYGIVPSALFISHELFGILLVTGFASNIIAYAQSIFVYEKLALSNLILSVGISFSTVALSLVLIGKADPEYMYIGRIYGIAIPYVVIAIGIWIKIFFKKPMWLKKDYTKFGILVGGPIVFHTLSHNVLTQSDRVMMSWMGINNEEIGIYSLFYTISSSLAVLLSTLNVSWGPFYFDGLEEHDWIGLDNKAKNFIEVFTFFTVALLLLGRELSSIMAPKDFQYGVGILPILIIAIYFTFLYQFPTNYEFFYKKTRIIAIGTALAGLTNIVLNFFLLPSYGMYGAAVATACAYLLLYIIHYMFVMRLTDGKYHLPAKKFRWGFFAVLVGTILFFALKDLAVLRWSICISLGVIELHRIIKRKGIF